MTSPIFKNISGPDSERIKKKMCKIFKEGRLNITVACNSAITDFFDVTFDFKSSTYNILSLGIIYRDNILSLQKTEQRDIIYA